MISRTHWFTTAGCLSVALGGVAFGNPTVDDHQAPIYTSFKTLKDCAVDCDGSKDGVRDIVFDSNTGKIDLVLLDSGVVCSPNGMSWDADKARFVSVPAVDSRLDNSNMPSSRYVGGGADLYSRHVGNGRVHGNGRVQTGDRFLLDSVVGCNLIGVERDGDGARKPADLGKVGGAYVDIQGGTVAYLMTSVGGFLGIGEESRVIPFDAIRFERNQDGNIEAHTTLSKDRLNKSPAFGSGPDNLNNPEYRDSLYSFHGIGRPDSDRRMAENASGLLPMDRLIGSEIRRAGENREFDVIEDFVIDTDTGDVTAAVCESGSLVPVDVLSWVNTGHEHFKIERPQGLSTSFKAGGNHVLASALEDLSVMARDEDVGSSDTIYFSTNARSIAYLTIDHDGVRVLPWSMVKLSNASANEERPTLQLPMTTKELETAPKLDGEVGATIYSPAFRERVSTFEKSHSTPSKKG